MRIYLDNAATTPMLPEVLEAMLPYLKDQFGNPSTQYSYGREARSVVEGARKSIANILHASAGEIYFTSCGTESNNTALYGAVRDLGVKRIITAKTEHHCVLHASESLQKYHATELIYLNVDKTGKLDPSELESLLKEDGTKTLVSLMHANNETGCLLDLALIAQLSKSYGALFHTDTVQTFAHYLIDTKEIPIDFLSGSAHKFHGPKGTGFLYVRKGHSISPLINGGGQERGLRSGTENVSGIAGLAKAAEIAYAHLTEDTARVQSLKTALYEKAQQCIPGAFINGPKCDEGLFTVLNMSFPIGKAGALSLFALDMEGLCVSGGSACSSGASSGSHVLEAMGITDNRINIRFSFSKLNTLEEVERAVSLLSKVLLES